MKYSIRSICFLLASFFFSALARAEDVDFDRDIAPILEERCWYCHGEDEQESGLRLDLRPTMLRGGDSGLPAVVPGEPEKSYLVELINHVDEEMAMPPDEEKMPAEEIELLTRWIKEGVQWPGQMDATLDESLDHWSFLPLQENYEHDSIDEFLEETLSAQALEFSRPAPAGALIRRASILLTGLAPTPERTNDFVSAFAVDADSAYSDLVEELLASPHFGERWAQHWLDVIRWAETNGSESNLYRKNAWMYRDYVVRAFNEDKPYNQFVSEQLAGDLMGQGDATGFLVAGPHVPAATVGQEPTAIRQARADRMDEVLQTVGASVMGVTIGCARCHNHKFDPLSIHDYYSMSAAFQDVEFGSRYPEIGETHPRAIRERELRRELASLRQKMKSKGWAWVEDWTGYQEIHFPPKTTQELRVSFDGRWVQIDELEIFESEDKGSNVLSPDFGTTITDNPDTHVKSQPIWRLTDGVVGTKGWRGVSPKESKERPWLDFKFPREVTIGSLRLSSNREDFYETDYLDGIQVDVRRVQDRAARARWRMETVQFNRRNEEAIEEQRNAAGAAGEDSGNDQRLVGGWSSARLPRTIRRSGRYIRAGTWQPRGPSRSRRPCRSEIAQRAIGFEARRFGAAAPKGVCQMARCARQPTHRACHGESDLAPHLWNGDRRHTE
ncbi:MAG: DUF1549 domain-containing protein [Rubripirellula sp.]